MPLLWSPSFGLVTFTWYIDNFNTTNLRFSSFFLLVSIFYGIEHGLVSIPLLLSHPAFKTVVSSVLAWKMLCLVTYSAIVYGSYIRLLHVKDWIVCFFKISLSYICFPYAGLCLLLKPYKLEIAFWRFLTVWY